MTGAFEEVDGRTRYVQVEGRDSWIPTDVDKGVREPVDLVAALVDGVS